MKFPVPHLKYVWFGVVAPGLVKQSQLFTDDHGHPSTPLKLLASYCHYASIHQRSPVGLPAPESLRGWSDAEAMNAALQHIAWDTVTAYPLSGVKEDMK